MNSAKFSFDLTHGEANRGVGEARDHRNHEIEETKEFLRAYRVEGEVRDRAVAAIAADEKLWQVK